MEKSEAKKGAENYSFYVENFLKMYKSESSSTMFSRISTQQMPQPISGEDPVQIVKPVVRSFLTAGNSQSGAEPGEDSSEKEEHRGNVEGFRDSNDEAQEERMYRCSKCNKTYLSYPALYTHTKLKHLQPGETPSITNGRMRGRPRKIVPTENGSLLDPTTPLFFRTEENSFVNTTN